MIYQYKCEYDTEIITLTLLKGYKKNKKHWKMAKKPYSV